MRRAAEVGVLIDARGDERMGDLQQERGGTAEEHEHLTVHPTRDGVAREHAEVTHTTSVALGMAFRFALEGLRYVVRSERNIRIQLVLAAAAIALGVWLGLGPIEWSLLALTIGLVLGLECLNTAIEITVTLVSPQAHPLAKAAKDVAAASVLVGAVAAAVVGLLLFGPRLVVVVFGP